MEQTLLEDWLWIMMQRKQFISINSSHSLYMWANNINSEQNWDLICG